MLPKKQNAAFFSLTAIFLLLFLFLKAQGDMITRYVYEHGGIAFLNKITSMKGEAPLSFYTGQMEEILFGPLQMVISGLLLLVFCLRYLKESSSRSFGLTIFAYLLIAKFEVLFFPLYGDAIGGPFAEALWLFQNGFNYIGLYHEEGYAFGGPKVYLFSIYPAFLALQMHIFSGSKGFLLFNHLLVFVMAATIVTIFRSIARKVFDSEISIIASLALISLPIFHSQTEAVNMEMPCLLFTMLCLLGLVRKNFVLATAMSVLATLVKETGVVACAAVFFVGVLLLFSKENVLRKKTIFICSIAAIIFAILKVVLKFLSKDQHAAGGMINFFVGWPSLDRSIILSLFLASFIVFVFHIVKEKHALKKNGGNLFKDFMDKYYVVIVMFLYASMWFLLFINFYAVSPRYRLILCPTLIFCVVFSFRLLFQGQTAVKVALIVFLTLSFFSVYGLFYAPLEENDHVLLERSLEYRNDLKVNMQVAKEIESRYGHMTVSAPFVLAQSLKFPLLGYVHKPLDAMIYGMRCTYGGIKNFEGLQNLDIGKTVWIGVKTHTDDKLKEYFPNYPLGDHDKLLKEVVVGDKKAIIFQGGFGIEKMRLMIEMATRVASQKISK